MGRRWSRPVRAVLRCDQSVVVVDRRHRRARGTSSARSSRPSHRGYRSSSGAVRVAPRTMASRRDPARDSRWVSTTADGRLGGDVADSLSQGVFILRKAPTVTKRVTARKSFYPLVPDETHEGMERRRDAYRACWAAADAHVSRVLAEANAEAFEKLEAFVKARFAERAEMRRANGGVVPQHAAQIIPVGLVLAGGISSDDHEALPSSRTTSETGCRTALLGRPPTRQGAGGAATQPQPQPVRTKVDRSHRGRIRRWWRRRRRTRRRRGYPRATQSRRRAGRPTARVSGRASDISSDGTAKSRKKTNRSIARKRRRRRRRKRATETETEKTERKRKRTASRRRLRSPPRRRVPARVRDPRGR